MKGFPVERLADLKIILQDLQVAEMDLSDLVTGIYDSAQEGDVWPDWAADIDNASVAVSEAVGCLRNALHGV